MRYTLPGSISILYTLLFIYMFIDEKALLRMLPIERLVSISLTVMAGALAVGLPYGFLVYQLYLSLWHMLTGGYSSEGLPRTSFFLHQLELELRGMGFQDLFEHFRSILRKRINPFHGMLSFGVLHMRTPQFIEWCRRQWSFIHGFTATLLSVGMFSLPVSFFMYIWAESLYPDLVLPIGAILSRPKFYIVASIIVSTLLGLLIARKRLIEFIKIGEMAFFPRYCHEYRPIVRGAIVAAIYLNIMRFPRLRSLMPRCYQALSRLPDSRALSDLLRDYGNYVGLIEMIDRKVPLFLRHRP